MSIEACVEELYGDTKEDSWKKEEVNRLKNEQGIAVMEEPQLNPSAGEFSISGFGGKTNEGEGSKKNIRNEPEEV